MNKEDVDAVAKLLSSMKDSINELDGAIKKKNGEKANAAKGKILELQVQISRKI